MLEFTSGKVDNPAIYSLDLQDAPRLRHCVRSSMTRYSTCLVKGRMRKPCHGLRIATLDTIA